MSHICQILSHLSPLLDSMDSGKSGKFVLLQYYQNKGLLIINVSQLLQIACWRVPPELIVTRLDWLVLGVRDRDRD